MKQKFIFLWRILFNKKLLIPALILSFLFEYVDPKSSFTGLLLWFETVLTFYLSLTLGFILFRFIKKGKKKIDFSIRLGLVVIAFAASALFYSQFDKLPSLILLPFEILIVISLSSFIFLFLNLLFLIFKKVFLVFLKILPKIKRSSRKIMVVIVVLFILGRYFWLEMRVSNLENQTGVKMSFCDEKKSIENIKKSLVRVEGVNAEGSGFVIDSSGLIVTNHHVIANDPHPKIVLPDYSVVQGEVVLADDTADLAIIKISGKKVPQVVSFGNSDKLDLMSSVISLGYPYGLEMKGDPTVIKGRFVAFREDKEMGEKLIQTDISLNPGASGGPMINSCGEVIGINFSGTAGLGMAISINDFKNKWQEMEKNSTLKNVQKIEINPNIGPKECAEAFYNYQTIGMLSEAYKLLTPNYTGNLVFETWKEGYKNTLNVVLYTTKLLKNDLVYVKFSSADLVGEDIVYKFFEGKLWVIKKGDQYFLDDYEIYEVPDPSPEWIYAPSKLEKMLE